LLNRGLGPAAGSYYKNAGCGQLQLHGNSCTSVYDSWLWLGPEELEALCRNLGLQGLVICCFFVLYQFL